MVAPATPTALVEGGVENFNGAVDALVQTGVLQRVLAQTDVRFSNSLIEASSPLKHSTGCVVARKRPQQSDAARSAGSHEGLGPEPGDDCRMPRRQSATIVQWRALKHQWLYLNALDSAAAVQKLVAFYVEQHNAHLPHAAFKGQTPDEMYFGTGDDVPQQLAAAKVAARQTRLAANRALRCQTCSGPVAVSN